MWRVLEENSIVSNKFIYLFVDLLINLQIYLFIYLYIYLFVYLFVSLFVYQFIYFFIYLFVYFLFILVNLSADPPICRLENYGQLMVKKKERAKEIRVNAKARSLKEMFIGGGIDKHDLGIKMKKVIEFLSDGHPVRIFVTAKKLRLKIEPFCVEETTMKVLEAVEEHVQSVQQPESATSSRKDFTLNPKIKKVESPSHKKKIKNSEGNDNDKKENENCSRRSRSPSNFFCFRLL